jgi:hypothetical protein
MILSVTDTNVSQNLSETFDEAFGVYRIRMFMCPYHDIYSILMK